MALCLSCPWAVTGLEAQARAAQHRDETSHAVVASTSDRL